MTASQQGHDLPCGPMRHLLHLQSARVCCCAIQWDLASHATCKGHFPRISCLRRCSRSTSSAPIHAMRAPCARYQCLLSDLLCAMQMPCTHLGIGRARDRGRHQHSSHCPNSARHRDPRKCEHMLTPSVSLWGGNVSAPISPPVSAPASVPVCCPGGPHEVMMPSTGGFSCPCTLPGPLQHREPQEM